MAESVFIVVMFVKYGRSYADICAHIGLKAEAASCLECIEKMEKAVLGTGWDGEWFRRAYDANGEVVGGRACEEG